MERSARICRLCGSRFVSMGQARRYCTKCIQRKNELGRKKREHENFSVSPFDALTSKTSKSIFGRTGISPNTRKEKSIC